MTFKQALDACRQIRDTPLLSPYELGRWYVVDWLRDQLGLRYVSGEHPDWGFVMAEVERVRAGWPDVLLQWERPEDVCPTE